MTDDEAVDRERRERHEDGLFEVMAEDGRLYWLAAESVAGIGTEGKASAVILTGGGRILSPARPDVLIARWLRARKYARGIRPIEDA